jgi:hypothetical protein
LQQARCFQWEIVMQFQKATKGECLQKGFEKSK